MNFGRPGQASPTIIQVVENCKLLNDFTHQSIFHSISGLHEVVTVRVFFNHGELLSSVFSKYFIEAIFHLQYSLSVDFDITRLSFGSTHDLVDHDFTIWQSKTFSFFSCSEKYRGHTFSHTNTNCGDVWFDVLHGIVDGHTGCYRSTRGVDIYFDVFFWI